VQSLRLRHAAQAFLVFLMALAITGAVAVRVGAGALSPGAAAHILNASRQATASPAALAPTIQATNPAQAQAPTSVPTPGPSGIKVTGGALVDAATDQILWSKNLDTERPIGSIVKVMTAMVVIEEGNLNQVIRVPKSMLGYLKSQDQPSVAGLKVGDHLTAQELLEALMLPSGCDAAYTLAMTYGPGITAFIAKMNALAQQWDLTSTYFSSFDGMPWPTEYSTWSTPANLIMLGLDAMQSPVFRAIVARSSYRLPAGDGHHGYFWQNANPLIGTWPGSSPYPSAIGIKTGDTKAAKNCLLFEATRGGLTLIGVTLGTPGDDISVTGPVATKVLNWGFAHY
jgi:D-alanyl-D-alanine carboxypeptidase (penicillin-binding protein 5/6)